jgi:hypothetical protein
MSGTLRTASPPALPQVAATQVSTVGYSPDAEMQSKASSSGALDDSEPSPDAFLPRDEAAATSSPGLAPPPPPPPSESPPPPSLPLPDHVPKPTPELAPQPFRSWHPPPNYWSRVGDTEPLTSLFCSAIRCHLDERAFVGTAADAAQERLPPAPRFEVMLAYAAAPSPLFYLLLSLTLNMPVFSSSPISHVGCVIPVDFRCAWLHCRCSCWPSYLWCPPFYF